MVWDNILIPRILALFAFFVFNIAFACFIFLARPKARDNKNFAAFILWVSIWSLSLGMYYIPGEGLLATFWARAVYFSGTSIATAFLIFALAFNKTRGLSVRTKLLLSIPRGIMFILYFFTPLMIEGVIDDESLNKKFIFGSSLHYLFELHFIPYIVASFAILYRKLLRSLGPERKGMLYIFFGTLLGYVISGFTNIFLPSFLNNTSLGWVGPYTTLPMNLAISYAIVKHRSFQVRVVAAQMLVAAIVVTLLFEAVLSETLLSLTVRISLFIAASYAGMLMIRAVSREVRQRERIEELARSLQRANVQLEQANKEITQAYATRSEFLDIASHQLRTPVSLIVGTLDMLREGVLDQLPGPKRREFMERAYSKAQKLNAVITDVLSAAEMDRPRFDVSGTTKPLDLRALARSVVESFREEAAERKLALRVEAPDDLPLVEGSEQYLRQALSNYVSNAVKYTKKGTVEVRLFAKGKDVFCEVEDTGIGIPPEELPKLWEKFMRAKNAREMYTDGSGLGLFIVKKIVEGHPRGRVFVKSAPGKGSTFGFRLPIVREKTPRDGT